MFTLVQMCCHCVLLGTMVRLLFEKKKTTHHYVTMALFNLLLQSGQTPALIYLSNVNRLNFVKQAFVTIA